MRIHSGGLAVSAKTGAGLVELAAAIEKQLTSAMREVMLEIPHSDYSFVSFLHREGSVEEETSGDESTVIRCRIPARLTDKVAKYLMDAEKE